MTIFTEKRLRALMQGLPKRERLFTTRLLNGEEAVKIETRTYISRDALKKMSDHLDKNSNYIARPIDGASLRIAGTDIENADNILASRGVSSINDRIKIGMDMFRIASEYHGEDAHKALTYIVSGEAHDQNTPATLEGMTQKQAKE